jgi:YidC/Oxa1 family membrane protein insertase
MFKRWITISVIVMALLALASCSRGDNETAHVVVNNPTNVSYAHDEADDITFTGTSGLSYWLLSKAGTSATLENYEGSLPTDVTTDENGVRTYVFEVEDFEVDFQVYVKPETTSGESDDIVMVAFRFEETNVLYPMGSTFNPEGIDVIIVRRDGSVETKAGEDLAENFDDGGFELLDGDEFVEEETYTVTFTYEGFEETFDVYVAGGERPIHPDAANFFDWILVIPVAFIMSFFAGLMGNSFALGILFTTLVVRTLAWPIYAKSNDMSIKMNLAQPDMQRVQAKYATKKDPQSQQQMQMEMMQVYKKHGINVFGCLMPFLQMPIFIAMYAVVRRITLEGGIYVNDVHNTRFLGIDLANTNDGIIGLLLAGIVGATMFILQQISMKKPSYAKNTGKHNADPKAEQTQKTMKTISYFMVIMMMFISFQSNALAIYWIFGNTYSLAQTLFNRKMNEKKHEAMKQKQLTG